jgi:hypothetical protein
MRFEQFEQIRQDETNIGASIGQKAVGALMRLGKVLKTTASKKATAATAAIALGVVPMAAGCAGDSGNADAQGRSTYGSAEGMPDHSETTMPDVADSPGQSDSEHGEETGLTTEIIAENFIFHMPNREGCKTSRSGNEQEDTLVYCKISDTKELYARYAGDRVSKKSMPDLEADHDVIHIGDMTIYVYSNKTYLSPRVDYEPKAGEIPLNETKSVYITAPSLNGGKLTPALDCFLRYHGGKDVYAEFNGILDYMIASVELK